MNQDQLKYRDRLRILLILYFFSEHHEDAAKPEVKKLFKSEVKIQKIDFLIRYPSYLCYELIQLPSLDQRVTEEIKTIIREIFQSEEPVFRTEEMIRFFYGSWESINGIISFLHAHNFIVFVSHRGSDHRVLDKQYFITEFGVNKIENDLKKIPSADWYFKRCELIKRFFGDMSGTELKIMQYQHPEVKDTPIGQVIRDIEEKTRELYINKFNEEL